MLARLRLVIAPLLQLERRMDQPLIRLFAQSPGKTLIYDWSWGNKTDARILWRASRKWIRLVQLRNEMKERGTGTDFRAY
jgi:hypothetical protein